MRLCLWMCFAGLVLCQTPEEELRLLEAAAAAAPLEPTPQLALASAYLEQYKPDNSPEHERLADRAESGLRLVIQMQPDNVQAMQQLANLFFARSGAKQDSAEKGRMLDESVYWNQRVLGLQPDNKLAHYTLGLIAWTRTFPEWMKVRNRLQMAPDRAGPLPNAKDRDELWSQYGSVVEEGIRSLQRAIELDPDYDDALAYLNLLYRQRADVQDSPEAYQRDIQTADQLVQRALELRRANGPGSTLSMRLGGLTHPARLIRQVTPIYPEAAIKLRLRGSVRFKGRITKDGTLVNITLLSGHPVLVPAATEAVRLFRYQPAALNGVPVEEDAEAKVDFILP